MLSKYRIIFVSNVGSIEIVVAIIETAFRMSLQERKSLKPKINFSSNLEKPKSQHKKLLKFYAAALKDEKLRKKYFVANILSGKYNKTFWL